MIRKETYQGNPLLVLFEENTKDGKTYENNKISFGLGKARVILAHLKDIKDFVEENKNHKSTSYLEKGNNRKETMKREKQEAVENYQRHRGIDDMPKKKVEDDEEIPF